jgi:Tol biopolymer transport system component
VQPAGCGLALATGLTLLAAVLPGAAGAAFPGRNGRIAFDNIAMLWLSPAPSGDLGILGRQGYRPKYSRSGRMVAYGCGTPEGDSCRRGVGIRIRRADGHGRPRRITRNRWDDSPDWSPRGHSIVFTRYPRGELTAPELWIYHRGHSTRLTPGEEPAWSIKGEIVFQRPDGTVPNEPWDIYVIRPNGSQLRRITAGFQAEWSPSGRKLIYASNGCGYACLYTIGRGGGGEHRLGRGISGVEPDFSPDGRQVVFSGGEDDQIVVMRSNGHRRRVIFQAAEPFVATDPDWQSLHGSRRFLPCGASASAAC